MKRIIQKLKSCAGFTLAETLVTVVILLLATGIIGAGMPAAINAYRSAIDAANAQVLLSATVNALRGELSTARDVKKVDDQTITYTSARTGSQSKLFLDGGVIKIQEYDDLAQGDTPEGFLEEDADSVSDLQPDEGGGHPLLDDAMRKTTRDGTPMAVVYTGINVDEEHSCVTISGLSVKRGEENDALELANMPDDADLIIRAFAVPGGD